MILNFKDFSDNFQAENLAVDVSCDFKFLNDRFNYGNGVLIQDLILVVGVTI